MMSCILNLQRREKSQCTNDSRYKFRSTIVSYTQMSIFYCLYAEWYRFSIPRREHRLRGYIYRKVDGSDRNK